MADEDVKAPVLKIGLRAQEHLEKLRDAGFDTHRFFDALVGIRDDPLLPKQHREAIYKVIAMESFIWYLEALRNEPIDRVKLLQEAEKIAEELSAAIRKQYPNERALRLAMADIGALPKEGQSAPPGEEPKAVPPPPPPPTAPASKPPAAAQPRPQVPPQPAPKPPVSAQPTPKAPASAPPAVRPQATPSPAVRPMPRPAPKPQKK